MTVAMDNPGIEINGEVIELITAHVADYLDLKNQAVKAEIAEVVHDALRKAHRIQGNRNDELEGFGSGLEDFDEENIDKYMKAFDASLERMLEGEYQ